MSRFKMEIDNGHIVLIPKENGKRYIVDTGSLDSFSRVAETLTLDNEEKQLNSKPKMLQMLQRINDNHLLAQEVDGLLGLDILRGNVWEFDFASQSILVNEAAQPEYEESLPLSISPMTGLSFDLSVRERSCQGILDSGAFVSYASSSLVADVAPCGEIDDYHPELGAIHTTLHLLAIRLGNREFNIKAGKMPQLLETMMSIAGIDCVLGITMLGLKRCLLDLIHQRFCF